MAYDPSLFEARRRGYQQSYGANSAMNAYSRFLAEQGGAKQRESLTRSYNKALPQLMGSYGRRGIAGPRVSSGIQRSGLGEFAMNKMRDFSSLTESLAQQNRQYDLQSSQLQAALQQNLADLEADKARQIAMDAQAILQQRAGGY
jgi:hypothetical protein